MHHFNPKTMPEEARQIFAVAFPEYTGRKFKLQGTDVINMASYWSGGSRDYFVVVSTENVLPIPQQSAFDQEVKGATRFSIPEGMCVVEHTIFQGKDMGLTIHVPTSRLAKMLPASMPLTDEQRTVLQLTASLKPAFRREHACRNGISNGRWAELVAELVGLGLLRKNGSITPDGKNQV